MTVAVAELIEDGGAASAGDEFFRSRPFLEAEGATHTLKITSEDIQLLAPLKVGGIAGTDLWDAVSPYGYPGLAGGGRGNSYRTPSAECPYGVTPTPAALDPKEIDWSATNLVSVFIRHVLGPSPLADGS